MCDLRGTWLRGSIAPYLGTRCRKRGRSNRGRTSPGSPSTSSLESPSERLPGDSLAFRLLLEGLREFQESGLSPSENDEVAYLLREEIGVLGDAEIPSDSSRERQLSLRRDLHDLSHRRHVRNPYYFNLVPGMVNSFIGVRRLPMALQTVTGRRYSDVQRSGHGRSSVARRRRR